MLKIATLMGALIISLPLTYPANAVQIEVTKPSPACPSTKEVSASAMARIYSINSDVVGVTIHGAKKERTSSFTTIDTTTTIANATCNMKVVTVSDECQAWVGELECNHIPTQLERLLISRTNADLRARKMAEVDSEMALFGLKQKPVPGMDYMTSEAQVKFSKELNSFGYGTDSVNDQNVLENLRDLLPEPKQ